VNSPTVNPEIVRNQFGRLRDADLSTPEFEQTFGRYLPRFSNNSLDIGERTFYTRPMNETALAQIGDLKALCLPRVSSTHWDPTTAKLGLRELRRLRGQMAAVEAVLVRVLKVEAGRDTRAVLARGFGMSAAEARKAEEVSDVVARVPGSEDALANGEVTGEHLRLLKPITDNDEAAELLTLAPSQPPDKFAKTVEQWRIDRDAEGWRARQHKARSVKFFKADNGCVGIRAILPTLSGEQVKAAINEACDAAWRAAHPDRAETLGGHEDAPREQRLADALINLITGKTSGTARTAVIVTMQAETLQAHILGAGPITTGEALGLVDDPRTDIYAAIQATDGAIMKFGRSRRLASPMQKLALALRDGGMCCEPGCLARWNRCDADHDPPFDHGGRTDIETMRLLCTCEHHPHRHETGANITRQSDGTWTVDGETFPPWPPLRPEPTAPSVEERETLRQLHRAVGRPDPYPELVDR
jgi:hypothetical protein